MIIKKNIAKAPAKLILFGEHSVLNGGLCISVAINKTGICRIKKSEETNIFCRDKLNNNLNLMKFLRINENGNIEVNSRSLNNSFCHTDLKLYHEVEVFLNLSLGCGLGSSAIISLLISSFIYYYENKQCIENPKRPIYILEKALELESIFHGKSSGVDVYTSFIGGIIGYRIGGFSRINCKYLKKFKILIYDSKIPKSTLDVINAVNNPNRISIYEKIDKISIEAENLIKKDFSLRELYILIRKNQDFLEELGLCPLSMKNKILKLRGLGIEAKITGAGAGGHLFTLVEQNVNIDGWEEVFIDEEGLEYLL